MSRNGLSARRSFIDLTTIIGILLLINMLLLGCSSVPAKKYGLEPTAQKLIGKTQADLLQCAGKPTTQRSYGQSLVLCYYKGAAMLEVSRPFLKGSLQTAIHHGCCARVLIENNRVAGIEFQTVPEAGEKHRDECEEIFESCSP